MPKHNFAGSFTYSKGTSVNSIHPKAVCLGDTQQKKIQNGISQKNDAPYADLFSSNIIRCTKSYMLDVRDNRLIHIQQYTPNTRDSHNEDNISNKEAEVVLFFIHGVGGSWKIWDSQIQNFVQEGYEIIALDLLGHGLSSTPDGYKPYEFSELALDVLFVFDKFCKRRNVLIGHSYGTSFCALLSTERGNLVSKMVLISGGGPTSLMPDKCSAFCLPLPVFFLIQPLLVKLFRRMAFHINTSRMIRDKITTFGVSAHVLKAIMQGQKWGESDEQYHSDLTVPALLIYGGGDQFVALSDEVWMNETIYSSRLEIIEDAGHMVMIEAPAEVNRLIQEFLNRDSSTRINKQNVYNNMQGSSNEMMNNISPLRHASSTGTRRTSISREQSVQGTPAKRCSSRLSHISSGSKHPGKKMY